MRILISVLALFILTTPGLFAQSSIQLALEGTASFPQARGSIDTIIFADLVGSSEPEAVLLDDSGLQVYSLSFPMQLIAEEQVLGDDRRITVADMNGDGLKDVVALSAYWYSGLGNLAVLLFDNASAFAPTDTIAFYQNSGSTFYHAPDSTRLLKAVDIDDDGNLEVVLSFEQMVGNSTYFADQLGGDIYIFQTIDSVARADSYRPIRTIDRINHPGGESVWLVDMRYVECADVQAINWLHMFSFIEQWMSPDSTYRFAAFNYPTYGGYCGAGDLGTYEDRRSDVSVRTWGKLTGDQSTIELVTVTAWKAACYNSDVDLDSAWTTLTLHRFTPDQPLQEMWTMDITGEDWQDFVYLPDYPGYFFAIVDSEFRQFRGGDGSLFQASASVPDGNLHWAKPFADSLYRLIAIDGNTVGFYRPDIVTSADDQPLVSLPETFTLSRPYPNPFNPSVSFSISLPHRTELTIAIYNTLGQQVATIFEGTLPAGERPFIWDGSGHSSGVYFIKAITDSATQTKKAVLVK